MRIRDLDSVLPAGPRSPRDYRVIATSLETPGSVLSTLASSEYTFVLEALCANPATPPETLLVLVPPEAGSFSDNARLLSLSRNPSSDEAVLRATAESISRWLAVVRDRGHPYSAALALAERAEVPHELLDEMLTKPGASAQFKRRMRQAIEERTPPKTLV